MSYWCLISVKHATTLMWSEKHRMGSVRVRGIEGEPSGWIESKDAIVTGQASPSDPLAKVRSARIALGFLYEDQSIYWTDRNFKEVVRTKLKEVDTTPYMYNATVNRVYTGTSAEVNGLAVDWMTGTVYWTDAFYHWIIAANGNRYDIFKHLITEGLSRPTGIAVYPQKG